MGYSLPNRRGKAKWVGDDLDPLWTTLWRFKIPSKVTFFMWTTVKGRLPNACLLCLREAGSINHLASIFFSPPIPVDPDSVIP